MAKTATAPTTTKKATKATKPVVPSIPSAALKPAKPSKAQVPSHVLSAAHAATTMQTALAETEKMVGGMDALIHFLHAHKVEATTPKKTILACVALFPECQEWVDMRRAWGKATARAKKSFTNAFRYALGQDGKGKDASKGTGKVSAALLAGLLKKAAEGAYENWSEDERSAVIDALESLREEMH